MNKLMMVTAVMLVLLVGSTNTVEIAPDISFIKMLPAGNPYQSLYDEMLYPTVRIESASGIGSGVIISATDFTDYILTAAHVVGNQSVVTVTIYTPLTPLFRGDFTASVVITDTSKDLALLRTQINTDLQDIIHKAKLANRNYIPYLFTPVYAIGCSLGLDPRPSQGIITSIYDNLRSSASYWEISAPILPGNSGGPVFTADTHELIGIAVWVKLCRGQLVTTMAGIVPISEIYSFLDNINHKVHKEH